MKFQNISIPGSKVMLCTRKRDERTNERAHARTDKPEAICPHLFSKLGAKKCGIITSMPVHFTLAHRLITSTYYIRQSFFKS